MLRKLFIYLLIITVFITGNGIVFAIHICFTSSTKTVSLFEDQSCGGKHAQQCHDENTCEVNSKCCLLQYSYYKLELPSAAKKFNIVDFIFPSLITQAIFTPKAETRSYVPPQVPDYNIDIPILFSQLLI